MFLPGFRRKLIALALCKSIESAIQWFQIHHRITFAIIQNPTAYLSGARVSIFSTLVPRLLQCVIVAFPGPTHFFYQPLYISVKGNIIGKIIGLTHSLMIYNLKLFMKS